MENHRIHPQTQWLVRKSGSAILGPYLTAQVRAMVEQGMLEARDEVCPENSYWFCLHEIQEVESKLGIPPEKLKAILVNSDGEETQSDVTLELEEETAPDLVRDGSRSSSMSVHRPQRGPKSVTVAQALSAQELASRFERVKAPGTVGAALGFSPDGVNVSDSARRKSSIGWALERSRFWSYLIIACLVLAGLGIVWVLQTLKIN